MLTKIKSLIVSSSYENLNVTDKANRILSLITTENKSCDKCKFWNNKHWIIYELNKTNVGVCESNNKDAFCASDMVGMNSFFITKHEFYCSFYRK